MSDPKSAEYVKRSECAAADIATWPKWMQRNLRAHREVHPPRGSVMTLIERITALLDRWEADGNGDMVSATAVRAELLAAEADRETQTLQLISYQSATQQLAVRAWLDDPATVDVVARALMGPAGVWATALWVPNLFDGVGPEERSVVAAALIAAIRHEVAPEPKVIEVEGADGVTHRVWEVAP